MQAISPASSLVDSLQLSVMPFGLTTVPNKLSSLFQFFGSSSETKTSSPTFVSAPYILLSPAVITSRDKFIRCFLNTLSFRFNVTLPISTGYVIKKKIDIRFFPYISKIKLGVVLTFKSMCISHIIQYCLDPILVLLCLWVSILQISKNMLLSWLKILIMDWNVKCRLPASPPHTHIKHPSSL